ncbi:MAG: YdcF family protein [Verrucomicrobiales bacterium]|nr:YdcF family protein [Verrucomicrobiales bacterium]
MPDKDPTTTDGGNEAAKLVWPGRGLRAILSDMEASFSRLVEPVGILWLISLTGLTIGIRKRQWPTIIALGLATLFISLAGSRLSTHLLASLERPYADARLENAPFCDAVVMLGGVLKRSEFDTFGIDLGEGADRAVTALELLRRGRAKILVFGGAGGQTRKEGPWLEGGLIEGWARAWGVMPTNTITLRRCANTYEEAMLVRELAQQHQWQRILLVTSAYHMKRSEGLFRRVGISTVPVASDFLASSELALIRPFNFVPDSARFKHLRLYLHEKIGWLYYLLRSRVQ